MSWEFQADGSVIAPATPRAIEWAAGGREELAAIGFVAFCRDFQLEPEWFVDTFRRVKCGQYELTALLDRADYHDRYEVTNPDGHYDGIGVVRVMSGSPTLLHILGVSWVAGPSGPRSHLLSCREWLRAFPVHHVIPPEAFDEEQRLQVRPDRLLHGSNRADDARAA